jgi:hypothetical protein
MSEQEQPNETQPIEMLINDEDKKLIENAFFSKTVKLFPLGVLVRAVNSKEEEVDVAINNEDIVDIYNAINGDSPYNEEDMSNE